VPSGPQAYPDHQEPVAEVDRGTHDAKFLVSASARIVDRKRVPGPAPDDAEH
jgi:hypothetical protein